MFAAAKGAKNIFQLPGCWESDVDGHWWIAINGHTETVSSSRGQDVPPFSVVIEFNGWPAGIIGPDGGVIAAGGAANEDTFIAALKASKGAADRLPDPDICPDCAGAGLPDAPCGTCGATGPRNGDPTETQSEN